MHLRTPSEVKRFIELASTYNAPHCLCLRLVDDELSVHLSRDGRGYLWRETMIALLTIIGKTELPIKKLSFHMSSLDVGHIDIQSMSAVSVGRHCRSLVMGQHLKDVRIIDNLDDPLTGIERMKNLFNHLSVTVERLELLRFNLIGTRESYKDLVSFISKRTFEEQKSIKLGIKRRKPAIFRLRLNSPRALGSFENGLCRKFGGRNCF